MQTSLALALHGVLCQPLTPGVVLLRLSLLLAAAAAAAVVVVVVVGADEARLPQSVM